MSKYNENWYDEWLATSVAPPEPEEEEREVKVVPSDDWYDQWLADEQLKKEIASQPPPPSPVLEGLTVKDETEEWIPMFKRKDTTNSLASFITGYAPPGENNTEKYIDDVSSIVGVSRDTSILDIDTDTLAGGIATIEGYNQSTEWNLNNIGRETNLPQEWFNPGMLEHHEQPGSSPSPEVRDSTGKLLHEEGRFAVFSSEEDGYAALKRDIEAKKQRAIESQNINKLVDESLSGNSIDTNQVQNVIPEDLVEISPGQYVSKDNPEAIFKHHFSSIFAEELENKEGKIKYKGGFRRMGGEMFEYPDEHWTSDEIYESAMSRAKDKMDELGYEQPKLTYRDVLRETFTTKEGWKKLPFVGGAAEAADAVMIMKDIHALKKYNEGDGEITEEQTQRLMDMFAEQGREGSISYYVAEIATYLPGYAAEIFFSGGFYTAGKETTEAAVKAGSKAMLKWFMREGGPEAIERAANKFGLKLVTKTLGAAGGTGKRLLHPAVYSRIAGSIMTEREASEVQNLADQLENIERSWTGEELKDVEAMPSWLEDTLVGTGKTYFEFFGEMSGAVFPFLKRESQEYLIKKGWFQSFFKLNPNLANKRGISKTQEIMKQIAYHNPAAEVFEERFTDLLTATLPDEEFTLPTRDQFIGEIIALSIPGAAFAIINGGSEIKNRKAAQRVIDAIYNGEADKLDAKTLIRGASYLSEEERLELGLTGAELTQKLIGVDIPTLLQEIANDVGEETGTVPVVEQLDLFQDATEKAPPTGEIPTVEAPAKEIVDMSKEELATELKGHHANSAKLSGMISAIKTKIGYENELSAPDQARIEAWEKDLTELEEMKATTVQYINHIMGQKKKIKEKKVKATPVTPAEAPAVEEVAEEAPALEPAKMLVRDLKAELKARKLPVSGNKADLAKRLNNALEPAVEAPAVEVVEEAPVEAPAKAPADMITKELVAELKSRGLPVYGNKAKLRKRLEDSLKPAKKVVEGAPVEAPPKKTKADKEVDALEKGMANANEFQNILEEPELQKGIPVNLLKSLAKKRGIDITGLKPKGKKQQILNRIFRDMHKKKEVTVEKSEPLAAKEEITKGEVANLKIDYKRVVGTLIHNKKELLDPNITGGRRKSLQGAIDAAENQLNIIKQKLEDTGTETGELESEARTAIEGVAIEDDITKDNAILGDDVVENVEILEDMVGVIRFADTKGSPYTLEQKIKAAGVVGAELILRGARSFKQFSAEMVRRYGPSIKAYAKKIWKAAKDYLKSPKIGLGVEIVGEAGKPLSLEEKHDIMISELSVNNILRGIEKTPNLKTKLDVSRYLDKRVRQLEKKYGIDLRDRSEESKDILADILALEIKAELKNTRNAKGWYSKKMQNAMNVMGLIYPKIKNNPEHAYAFKFILAITSNGQPVKSNLVYAMEQYEYWAQYGSMNETFGKGKESASMKKAWEVYNEMVDNLGVDVVNLYLNTEFTRREIEKEAKFKKISGEFMETIVPGSIIFGPKVGGAFHANISGLYEYLTMDRWFVATMGRIMGTSTTDWTGKPQDMHEVIPNKTMGKQADGTLPRISPYDAFYQTLRKPENKDIRKSLGVTLKDLKKTDENFILKIARGIFEEYEGSGFKDRSLLNRLSKALIKGRVDFIHESPTSAGERAFYRDVFKRVIDRLGDENMTVADAQAVIWFPEKRLHNNLKKTKTSEETNYEKEATDIARERGIDDKRIRGALGRPRPGKANKKLSKDTKDNERPEVFTKKQKQDFLEGRNPLTYEEWRSVEMGFLGITPGNIKLLNKTLVQIGRFTYDTMSKGTQALGKKLGVTAENFKQRFGEYANNIKAFKGSLAAWFKKVYNSMKSWWNKNKFQPGFIKPGQIFLFDKTQAEVKADKVENIYDKILNKKKAYREITKTVRQTGIWKYMGIPLGSRSRRIAIALKRVLRDYTKTIDKQTYIDSKKIVGFVEKYKKMPKQVKEAMSAALYNSDENQVGIFAVQYDMVEELKEVQKVLSDIYERAVASGYRIHQLEYYWPRKVKSVNQFQTYLYDPEGIDMRGVLDKAVTDEQNKVGHLLGEAEKIEIYNKVLMSRMKRGGPGALKSRSIDVVDDALIEFYEPADISLMTYIQTMNESIARQNFFGKGVDIRGDLKKNVGEVVNEMIVDKEITPDQQYEVSHILNDLFNQAGTPAIISKIKNATYVFAIGDLVTWASQVPELAMALYTAGPRSFSKAFAKQLVGKSQIKVEDLGIDNILLEMSAPASGTSYLRKLFKSTGFYHMDKLGKQVLINGTIDKLRRHAKKWGDNPTLQWYDIFQKHIFKTTLSDIFGEGNTAQIVKDLQEGKVTDDILTLAYNILLDKQPVSILEMPSGWINHSYLRLAYQLKTWMVKTLDVFRTETWDKINHGKTKRERALGVKNLFHLGFLLALGNAGGDEIRRYIFGQDDEINDRWWWNILKYIGLSQYHLDKYNKTGEPLDIIWDWGKPASWGYGDKVASDVKLLYDWWSGDIKDGEESLFYGLESPGMLPWVGRELYNGVPSAGWDGMGGRKKYLQRQIREFEEIVSGGSIARGITGKGRDLTGTEQHQYDSYIRELSEIKEYETEERGEAYEKLDKKAKEGTNNHIEDTQLWGI